MSETPYGPAIVEKQVTGSMTDEIKASLLSSAADAGVVSSVTILPAAMSVDDAARYVGVSDTQVRRLMIERGFPKGFMISQNRRVILRSEIDKWLDEQSDARAVECRDEPIALRDARKRRSSV